MFLELLVSGGEDRTVRGPYINDYTAKLISQQNFSLVLANGQMSTPIPYGCAHHLCVLLPKL